MKKITLMCLFLLTFCLQSQAQFTENFDASTTLPAGWSIINQGGANGWTIFNQGTGAHSGTNIARIQYDSTAHDDYLISPFIDVIGGVNDRISFYIKSLNSGYLEPYEVLLSTTTNTASSDFTVVLQSSQLASAAAWEKKEISLAAYDGQGVYIAIRATGTDRDRLAVDDFVNDAAPTCPQPTVLTASTVTQTTAILSWTEAGTASLYNVEIVAANATPTGTATDIGVTNPFNKTSLLPSTAYDYYVQADCGGGDVSLWSGPFRFTTLCNPYTIPYFEGFESGYTQDVAVGGCLYQQSITGAEVWTANTTLTDYNRTPRTGSWNAYLKYSNDDWLFIPIDLVGGTSYTVDFFARQDGATNTDASIAVSYGTTATAAGMTNAIVAATGIVNGNYQEISGAFTPATSGTYYVGIKGFMNGTPWYISIDDISIDVTPTCLAPTSLLATNITASSAVLGWTNSGSATTWNIEWGPAGFLPGSGNTIFGVNVNPYLLEGLTSDTSYSFYVQADCGGGDTSTWRGPFYFSTLISCPAPTALTATGITFSSANLGWTEAASATTWNIQWGATGFTLGSGNMITGTSTNPYPLTGLSSETSYSFYVQADCGGGDTSTWSGPYSFYTGYCVPAGTSSATYINTFSTTNGAVNINNATSGFSTANYGNMYSTMAVSKAPGGVINFNVVIVSGTVGCAIWIDWNNNLVFETSEVAYSTTAYGNGPFTGTITVPSGAADGDYRMRVMIDYNDSNPGDDAACSFSSGRGEVEDYKLTVDATLASATFDTANFVAYPNPVKDVLNLSYSSDITAVQIINLLGQEVMSKKIGTTSTQIDMSDLNAGAYIVNVTVNNTVKSIKVIKQ